MHKRTFIIVISLMFGLAGVFCYLAVKEDLNRLMRRKQKELMERYRQREFDKMIKLVNSQH